MKLAREVYREDLAAAKAPGQKSELARKLSGAAADEQKDPAGRFALLTLAREVALEGGDIEAAYAAIDLIDRTYLVDALTLKHDTALGAVKTLGTAEHRRQFLKEVDPVIELLVAKDRYVPARQLAESALAVARQVAEPPLIRRAASRLQSIREAEAGYGEARVAAAVLRRKPDDPDAALKVGRFRCLLKGDWEAGLPLLARSSDPALRSLAGQEMSTPSSPAEQVALGDKWWDTADRMNETSKDHARQHAGKWYRQALPGLDKGLLRQRVEHRLQQLALAGGQEQPEEKAVLETFRWADLPRYSNLQLVPGWEKLGPRKTLQAQTVRGSLNLKKQDSPYLVIGFLAVEPDATLTIEPGVIVLFAPGAQLTGKGTLSMNSEEGWIVLAAATRGQNWKGISSTGRVSARRCLIVGADNGVSVDHAKDGLNAAECVFAGNHNGVLVGEHGSATLRDCVLFRNETAIGTEADGAVTFSKCLLAVNGKGYAARYSGKCNGTDSTLLANEVGVESGIYGDASEVHGCNILASTKLQANTRGTSASMNLRHNFWGKDVSRAIAAGQARSIQGKVDAIEWLEEPAKDALPSLPRCEYVAY